VRHASTKRTAKAIKQRIERELVSRWGARPIIDIEKRDVTKMVEEIDDRGTRDAARQSLLYCKRIFKWALNRDVYGLTANPCDRIDAVDLLGVRKPRQRVLNDHEIRLVWRATEGGPFPAAPFFRMLLITGQRRSEVAEMTWDEVDLDKALWTLSAERMKGDIAHTVPLPAMAVELLRSLPRLPGPLVFSTTGRKPIIDFNWIKDKLDGRIAELIDGQRIADWRLHDLRRSVRTNLSKIGITPFIAELVIGHRQKGVHAVYDVHTYDSEKRVALEHWAARLRDIVEPPPADTVEPSPTELNKVVPMRARRRS
jgi:integrase